MVASAQSETELAKSFRNEFIARNRDPARLLLERCVEEQLVERPPDIALALDLIFGPCSTACRWATRRSPAAWSSN